MGVAALLHRRSLRLFKRRQPSCFRLLSLLFDVNTMYSFSILFYPHRIEKGFYIRLVVVVVVVVVIGLVKFTRLGGSSRS